MIAITPTAFDRARNDLDRLKGLRPQGKSVLAMVDNRAGQVANGKGHAILTQFDRNRVASICSNRKQNGASTTARLLRGDLGDKASRDEIANDLCNSGRGYATQTSEICAGERSLFGDEAKHDILIQIAQ